MDSSSSSSSSSNQFNKDKNITHITKEREQYVKVETAINEILITNNDLSESKLQLLYQIKNCINQLIFNTHHDNIESLNQQTHKINKKTSV